MRSSSGADGIGGKMLQLDEIKSQLPVLKEQIEEVGGYL